MIRYRLASLVEGRRKGATAHLPVIAGTLAAEREYVKALRTILREMARETRENIAPLAVTEIAASRTHADADISNILIRMGASASVAADYRFRTLMRDADETWFQRLIEMTVRLSFSAEQMVSRILGLEARRHTERFMETAKRALGVDLAAVVREEDLGDYLRTAGLRNAALIKGLADDTVKRVQQAVLNAVLRGRSAEDLKADLTKQFHVSDNRARLIARDQIAKLNSDMNKIRHQQAGISKYVWRTSVDERVRGNPNGRYPRARPSHHALEGKVYRYGEPTGAEGGLEPGQPILCRCTGQAIVEF